MRLALLTCGASGPENRRLHDRPPIVFPFEQDEVSGATEKIAGISNVHERLIVRLIESDRGEQSETGRVRILLNKALPRCPARIENPVCLLGSYECHAARRFDVRSQITLESGLRIEVFLGGWVGGTIECLPIGWASVARGSHSRGKACRSLRVKYDLSRIVPAFEHRLAKSGRVDGGVMKGRAAIGRRTGRLRI